MNTIKRDRTKYGVHNKCYQITFQIPTSIYTHILANYLQQLVQSRSHSTNLTFFKIFWAVWSQHGNTHRNENFIFSVGFLGYLAIHVIVVVPTASVYQKNNCVCIQRMEVHLFIFENVSFQSRLVLFTHLIENEKFPNSNNRLTVKQNLCICICC